MANAGGMASGVSIAEHAAGGRDALAAAEAQPDGIDVPDDRGQPGGGRQVPAVTHVEREPDARGALRHVEHGDEHPGRHARGTQTLAAPRLPLPT